MEINKEAYNYSIRLLSKRDYSRFKLRQKLLQRDHDEAEIEEVIQKLVDLKFLREEEYTRIRVKTLMLNGHANKVIQMRLEAEELFVDDEFIDGIRRDYSMESEDVVEALIQKKLRGKVIPEDFEAKMKLQNKLLSFLVSKGHHYQDIKDRVSHHLDQRNYND